MDFCSLEENFVLLIRADILFLILACLEAVDLIYVMLGISSMFTILKGLEMSYRPFTPRESLSFFCSLKCLGVTVRLSASKSYWVTSEME